MAKTDLYSLMPSRSSWSSRQLKATIFSSGTPWTSRIWQTAREKPHWGMDGVPFMKRTSGCLLTTCAGGKGVGQGRTKRSRSIVARTPSILLRASCERLRCWDAMRAQFGRLASGARACAVHEAGRAAVRSNPVQEAALIFPFRGVCEWSDLTSGESPTRL